MKKILHFIIVCILFIPLLVNAETCDNDKVTISSIELENKSNNVEELDNASASNNNININLNMSNVGDNIKYKFIVKNDSNDDYYLNKNSIKVSSNYIDYNIESGDNSNIVKAKTAKAFYLNVLYKNQVPENAFENGSFNDEITMKVNLSSDNIKNPDTGIKYYLIIVFIITIMLVMTFSFKKKRKTNRFEFLIVGLILLLPIGVKALCNVDININSNIKIDKPIDCGSFATDSWSVISQNVINHNDDCYHVGDTKEVDMGTYGTHTVRIANKSTPDECSNSDFSQTACGFVIEFNDSVADYYMKEDSSNRGGWEACDMRVFVNNDIFNSLPEELRNIIIETFVVSGHGYLDQNNFMSVDKLYLLSSHEIWGEIDNPVDTAYNNTRQLDYYSMKGVTIDNYDDATKYNGSTKLLLWLRSTTWRLSDHFDMNNSGFMYGYYSGVPYGVSPAFRIGLNIKY